MREAHPVKVFWPEPDAAREVAIEEECRRLVSELASMGAERIILFGSRARGEPRSSSDIDLLVILPGAAGPFPSRLAELYSRLKPQVAVDLLVYTPEELQAIRDRPLIREALTQGKVLHAA